MREQSPHFSSTLRGTHSTTSTKSPDDRAGPRSAPAAAAKAFSFRYCKLLGTRRVPAQRILLVDRPASFTPPILFCCPTNEVPSIYRVISSRLTPHPVFCAQVQNFCLFLFMITFDPRSKPRYMAAGLSPMRRFNRTGKQTATGFHCDNVHPTYSHHSGFVERPRFSQRPTIKRKRLSLSSQLPVDGFVLTSTLPQSVSIDSINSMATDSKHLFSVHGSPSSVPALSATRSGVMFQYDYVIAHPRSHHSDPTPKAKQRDGGAPVLHALSPTQLTSSSRSASLSPLSHGSLVHADICT